MSLLSRIAVEAARAYGMLVGKQGVSASYLVVAGGGSGGGGGSSGGGGAGGLLTSTFTLSTLNTYSITVGAGAAAPSNNTTGNNGSNSVISGTGLSTITSTGGGGGGNGANAGNGGSGGGAYPFNSAGTGTSGQGNNGGAGSGSSPYAAGGGGGAGAVGGTGSGTQSGAGGAGTASSISGSSVTYAGGGGGGGNATYTTLTNGAGGSGGGGAGQPSASGTATAGTANLGGGGGGGSGYNSLGGGAGGSGIVIISYASATPLFVGGTLTTSGGNQIHTFTSSGTLSPLTPVTASYLVVAGGGGGGNGGGGAGGLQTSSTTLYSGATYVVTVGAGGARGTGGNVSGTNGGNSVLSGTGLTTLTSVGGGGGAAIGSGGLAGLNGGSGGGGFVGGAGGSGVYAGGTGTSGQGNNGGSSYTYVANNSSTGGGGGAGAVGGTPTATNQGGNGGIGVQSSISGTATYYAGGGGGGIYVNATSPTGGTGGGGNGATGNSPGFEGTANTGGGGGGGYSPAYGNAYAGGSGVVIISYAGSQVFNGGLVTSSGGNTIHTFTATGALTPLTNNINNSLRFRSSASAYLSRTPTVTSNQKTWTWSAWVKRGTLSTLNPLFDGVGAGTGSAQTLITFTSTDTLRVYTDNATSSDLQTTQVFRDPSAWYHIVVAFDTTQATAANRVKIYVNGNQITAFGTASYPAQNLNTAINLTNQHNIGKPYDAFYFDGYMTDVTLVDGQQLEPYYFGNNDANGVWKPIQYKGTYGTNGYYLTFGNTTSTTTLGYDSSPNGNNWTCNNISLTAGTTYDAMLDVPTNTSATVANYSVINPLPGPQAANIGLITNANLSIANNAGATNMFGFGSMSMDSGKFYWEVTVTGIPTANGSTMAIGICGQPYTDATMRGYYNNGNYWTGSASISYGASYTTNDIIGIAFDATNQTIEFYKNGTSQGQKTSIGTSGTNEFAWILSSSTPGAASFNFGQRPFSYTPPTGYVALNTYNLPTPTILQGNKYMGASLYTGTATTQVVVNQAQFKPDFVWTKSRSNASTDNILIDSTRGLNKILYSNATDAEATASFIDSLNSNGYTLNSAAGNSGNASARTYVGWQWQAGQGSTSSNTSGSITSTVSVNTTAGFSIVTWTGAGSSATIGHGLGVAPNFIILKRRNSAVNWYVGGSNIASAGNGTWSSVLEGLNTTAAVNTGATAVFNSTAPTSTVFTGGSELTANGGTYVAYCWAEIAGFSKFGSYTGNGNADGTFVYLGFRPIFIMIKASSSAGYNWYIWDTARNTYNVLGEELSPNLSDAAATQTDLDITSNGFKLRTSASRANGSSITYIYAAFASNPFKNSNSF